MPSSVSHSKSQYPAEWDAWLVLPRPRLVRMKKGLWFWIALICTAMIAIPTVLLGALFLEWQAHPAKQMMTDDVWRAMPFIGSGLLILLSIYIFLNKTRRLVTSGELTIGRVTGVRTKGRRQKRIVTYEFLDRSGRSITASCGDSSRTFSEGMAIPVFFNFENPKRDQVALCGSPYEIVVSQ
jgi:hypothetical protein